MIDIKNIEKYELEIELYKLGGKKFNAKQIFDWVYKKRAGSFEIMSNLNKSFREKLKELFNFTQLESVKKQNSKVVTSAIRGVFAKDAKARSEAMSLIKG